MHIDRKYYFITIAETGNITKAAELLNVSQPSLSQYITRLEKNIGVKLINRNCSPIKLTEAGNIYLQYLTKSRQLDTALKEDLSKFTGIDKNRLTIGIPAQVTSIIFSIAVEDFIQERLDSQISIKGGTSLTMLEKLRNREIDIAFIHTRKTRIPDIITYVLQEEKLYLVCNCKNVVVNGRKSSRKNPIELDINELKTLEKQRFMILSKEYFLHEVSEEFFSAADIKPTNIIELSSLDTILTYICKNGSDIVAFVPGFALRNMKNMDNLAFLSVKNVSFTWYLTICRNKYSELTKLSRQFWDKVISIKWNI
ncbi:LysR family transcriptional regulator [Lachnospiraceae bacterium NSJ-143]|nr:LysR family transcriptional regulator [Lachnospiraceae bacterium NSJ-143]